MAQWQLCLEIQNCSKTTSPTWGKGLNLTRFSMTFAILSAISFWYLHLQVLMKITYHMNSHPLHVVCMGGGVLHERRENPSEQHHGFVWLWSNTYFSILLPHKTYTNVSETLKVISVMNSFHSTVMLTNFIERLWSDCRIHFWLIRPKVLIMKQQVG